MAKVRLAMVGCGGMAGAHMDGYAAQFQHGFDDFEVVAFCDILPEQAQKYADRYEKLTGVRCPCFDSVDALLASGIDFTAAEVQVPHDVHHVVSCKLMDAGKDMITEKPLGITMRAAKQIIDCARKNHVSLKVTEQYRNAVAERAAAWAVKSGMIGTPRLVTMMDVGLRQWYWDWRDQFYRAGGAWTMDGGIHFMDLWMNILGPIRRVTAVSRTYDTMRYKKFDASKQPETVAYRKTRSLLSVNPDTFGEPVEADVEDTTSAILEFESGVLGTWLVSRAAPGKVNRSISISGSEGTLTWNEGISDYKGDIVTTWEQLKSMYLDSLTPEEKEKVFPGGVTNETGLSQRDYLDFVAGKKPQMEVDGELGYLDLAIPMAVYESAATGRSVLVKDVMDLKEETYQKPINDKLGIK